MITPTFAPSGLSHELLVSMEETARRARLNIRDPEARREACRRMDAIREEILKREGILDIGVPAIRELRDR